MEIITQSESKSAIEKRNELATERFCPLHEGHCNVKCVAYLPAKYIEITDKTGRIAFGCCDSPMLIRRQ